MSAEPLRIALLSHNWEPTNGAGACARELYSALEERAEVELVVRPDELASVTGGLRSSGTKMLRAFRAWWLLRRRRVEVVIVNTTIQSSSVVAARLAGCHVVWWCHESGSSLQHPIMQTRWRLYDALSVRMVVPSNAVPVSMTPRIVIRNALAAPVEMPSGPASQVLVLGTKSTTKDTDRLPDLLDPAQLAPGTSLAVIGDVVAHEGDLMASTRVRLANLWGDTLVWSEAKQDTDSIFRTAAVVIVPSRADTRPRVVEEALARGIPVVASDLPGIREIRNEMDEGEYLTLTGEGDNWNAVVREAMSRGPQQRHLMSNFTTRELADSWVTLLLGLAEQSGPR